MVIEWIRKSDEWLSTIYFARAAAHAPLPRILPHAAARGTARSDAHGAWLLLPLLCGGLRSAACLCLPHCAAHLCRTAAIACVTYTLRLPATV